MLGRLIVFFYECLKISTFVIGGGYAIIAVADEVFAKRGWIEEGELLERLPVFQTVPGLIATHSAVYVGNKVCGALGAAVGVAAMAIPSIVIFSLVAMGYKSLPLESPLLQGVFVGLRAALTGIIAATILRSWKKNLGDATAYLFMIAGVVAIGVLGLNVALVLIVAILLGIVHEVRPHSARPLCVNLLPLLVFLKYGALCFGGGFVIVPMYLQDFVGPLATYLQIDTAEFSDVMALSQMTPGPIGVNCATFFGYRMFGICGAVVASVLLLLPGSVGVYFVLRSLERFKASGIVRGMMRGIRPMSVSMMLVALWAFARISCGGVLGVVLTVFAAVCGYYRWLGVIRLIFLSAAVSFLITLI